MIAELLEKDKWNILGIVTLVAPFLIAAVKLFITIYFSIVYFGSLSIDKRLSANHNKQHKQQY